MTNEEMVDNIKTTVINTMVDPAIKSIKLDLSWGSITAGNHIEVKPFINIEIVKKD